MAIKKTDHRAFIEQRLSEIEEQLEREGVLIEHTTYNGDVNMKKHPLVDAYTQLIQALTKIDPEAVKKPKGIDLKDLL